ncbi:MAG: ShlB/FhaC/HecB family hemolysin secretion/activation protein, partial [Candidatus Omnitrophica bacterium]|nr:ShlB/FhaC/HecB family hemolysin secretion/activation protein [Candidatus Omnitrophota bacterium]
MFIKIVPFVLASFLLFNLPCFAALTASQQMSGQFHASEIQQEQNELLKQIQRPLKKAKSKPAAKKVVSKIAAPRKVLIKRIHVQGVTVFAAAKIRAITAGYENKELTLSEIHQITNRITQLYRENGYVLSRAYIPPQKINQGVLEIKV